MLCTGVLRLPRSKVSGLASVSGRANTSDAVQSNSSAKSSGEGNSTLTRSNTFSYPDTFAGSQIICAITESRGTSPTVGLACIDTSTSKAVLCQIADNQTYTRTIHKLWVWDCTTLVMPSTMMIPTQSKMAMFIAASPDLETRLVSTDRKFFSEHCGSELIEQLAFGDEVDSLKVALEGKYYAVACFSAAIQHLKLDVNIVFASQTLRISFEPSEGSMMMDLSTIRSLEIVQNLRDRKSNDCLLGLMDDTMTPMGSRLLKSNVLQPLLDPHIIGKRYDAVEELSSNENLYLGIRRSLAGFLDVDRALTNLVIIPGPKRLLEWLQNSINYVLVLKRYLADAREIFEALKSAHGELLRQILQTCDANAYSMVDELIDHWINKDTAFSRKPAELQAQRIFAVRSGTNGLLDVARQAFKETLDDVYEHCEDLKRLHGLSLSVEFDNKRGRYLRFPLAELEAHDIEPNVFINTTRNKKHVECQTMDLVKLNSRLVGSQAEVMNMSMSAIQELIEQLRVHIAPLFRMSDSIALLDVLVSFASVGTRFEYVKPRLGSTLAIKAARHPIRIKISDTTFVANDCFATCDSRLQIITGCNMSGKSTYIRTIALLQIMAQVGSFVPAEFASFVVRDQLFARVSTDDNATSNISTFSTEMREAAFILRNVDARSLVIIDELGRGTSSDDGLSIAISIAHALLESRANIWFVTHFHDLARYFSDRPGVANLHLTMDYQPEEKKMFMLYKIASGPMQLRSYGALMADTLQFPDIFIDDARSVAQFLREQKDKRMGTSGATLQTNKRKLILGLKDQLLFAHESGMDPDQLRVWLQSLQKEFVIRLAALSSPYGGIMSPFVRHHEHGYRPPLNIPTSDQTVVHLRSDSAVSSLVLSHPSSDKSCRGRSLPSPPHYRESRAGMSETQFRYPGSIGDTDDVPDLITEHPRISETSVAENTP